MAGTRKPLVHRPRVEGEREQEILDAALTLLDEVGYDRLTMDAVATAAKASKATLYRRWNVQGERSSSTPCSRQGGAAGRVPDTGSLRGDLSQMFCGHRRAHRRTRPSRCSPA